MQLYEHQKNKFDLNINEISSKLTRQIENEMDLLYSLNASHSNAKKFFLLHYN